MKEQKESKRMKCLRHASLFLLFLTLIAFLSSCEKSTELKEKDLKSEIIVASIDGQEISLEYLEIRRNFFNSQISKKEFLNNIIIPQVLILQESKKLGINVSDKEVNTEFQNYKESSRRSEQEFNEYIKNLGLDQKTAKELIKEALILEKTSNAIVPEDPKISDEEIKKFYDLNKDYFTKINSNLQDAREFIKEEITSEKKQDKLDQYLLKTAAEKKITIYMDALEK